MNGIFVVEGGVIVNTVTHERIQGVEGYLESMAWHMNGAYRRGYRAAQKNIRAVLGVKE